MEKKNAEVGLQAPKDAGDGWRAHRHGFGRPRERARISHGDKHFKGAQSIHFNNTYFNFQNTLLHNTNILSIYESDYRAAMTNGTSADNTEKG